MIIIEEESRDIKNLNEMFVRVYDSLPTKIENSIYYPKLKQLLMFELKRFTVEQLELFQDLDIFRRNVGEILSESEIREYLDSLKAKYNGVLNNVGLDYHIEVTRVDFGVPVFITIQRANNIHLKKFVFRFRKGSPSQSLSGLDLGGIPRPEQEDNKKNDSKARLAEEIEE
jgi:hypothetical protein